jgi:hypothetical protein
MPADLVLTINFGDDFEGALRTYASLIDVPREELGNVDPGFVFSGACVPSLFTLMRPAHVEVKTRGK